MEPALLTSAGGLQVPEDRVVLNPAHEFMVAVAVT